MEEEEKEKKIDQQWKEQAKEEKEKAASEQEPEQTQGLPEPDFLTFLSGMATQVLINLGLVDNPITKQKEKNLTAAKYTIDLIQILEEKTKGNLTDEEKKYFDTILYDLRMHYIKESSNA